ncbi:unnamed protein product [Vitrella brassicaformis CCMP3155]|uniref:F-box domain-containing protein n=1 Tax=Vitrella brassicaformis (strain CCMP3155) TaxID=1169540 RepID=A0A0G4EFV0_VITBC|nr:unnamed protein product [Vitrella brassicaformis CCMP3155]|eukprot:CEL94572.1 unnamed protein product [Vitrella brassicaformis CCMP3155]
MAATSLSEAVPYALPYVDGRDLFILERVCKELKALVDPDPSSAIWRLQYHRSFGKRGKGNIRLISSSAHFPRESVSNPSAYVPLPEGDYREAYRRSRVVEDFGANAEVSELRWGHAKCIKPRDGMKRSRSSIFIAGPSLYVFGGVVGGKGENRLSKKLWRVSLASLVSGGKYEWKRCRVDGVAPRPSDALTLTPLNIAPPLRAPHTQPEWPKRYFAAGGPRGSDTDNPWGVLEINREEGGAGATYQHQWLSKAELRGEEKKSTPPLNRRFFTSTCVPIRSSAHPHGYIFIIGGKNTYGEALSSSIIVDVATWSFNNSDDNVSGPRPTARLNHTATLVKDRYVFIIGGEEWDHEIDSDFDDDEFDSEYGPSERFMPMGFASPPRLNIFDGEGKTWIIFSCLPWVSRGTFPLVDDALRSYLASAEGHRCDFARHTAVLAGDKIVINLPYANYADFGARFGGMKTLIFDITTGRFSKPAFATRPQKMCGTAPPAGTTPRPAPETPYKPYEPPPAACAAAVWTGSDVILFGGASLLDEQWDRDDPETHYDDGNRHEQTKHSEISVLGVMDRTTNDQTVPVDRHQQVLPFSRRYVWNRQLWQMDIRGGDARFDVDMWDNEEQIEQQWYEERQAIAESKANERQQLRERGVEVEIESGEGDEYDGMEGYTEKDINDHLCGKPLPYNKVFGKPITPTRHQALSKLFTEARTLPTASSAATTTPKITKYFRRVRGPKTPLVQSSLTDFFPFRTACRQTINHGYKSLDRDGNGSKKRKRDLMADGGKKRRRNEEDENDDEDERPEWAKGMTVWQYERALVEEEKKKQYREHENHYG